MEMKIASSWQQVLVLEGSSYRESTVNSLMESWGVRSTEYVLSVEKIKVFVIKIH